jgi:hypothetical protein
LVYFQPFFDYGDQYIYGYRDPNFCFNGIFKDTIESFNSQALLYPFIKKLYLPPAFIKVGNGERRASKIMGEKNQPFIF